MLFRTWIKQDLESALDVTDMQIVPLRMIQIVIYISYGLVATSLLKGLELRTFWYYWCDTYLNILFFLIFEFLFFKCFLSLVEKWRCELERSYLIKSTLYANDKEKWSSDATPALKIDRECRALLPQASLFSSLCGVFFNGENAVSRGRHEKNQRTVSVSLNAPPPPPPAFFLLLLVNHSSRDWQGPFKGISPSLEVKFIELCQFNLVECFVLEPMFSHDLDETPLTRMFEWGRKTGKRGRDAIHDDGALLIGNVYMVSKQSWWSIFCGLGHLLGPPPSLGPR